MKKSLILLILSTSFIFSCSNDGEDPSPQNEELKEAKLNFGTESQQVVELPPALLDQDDNPYAYVVSGAMAQANLFLTYASLWQQIPDNATKTSQPIVPANGRMASTTEEYLVYVYDYSGYGAMAYQVHEDGDKYIFEFFIKYSESSEWHRYLYAEESKSEDQGKLIFYGEESDVTTTFEWEITNDILNYEIYSEGTLTFKMTQDQNSLAGTIEIYEEGSLSVELTWDGSGSGSYTSYNSDGSIDESQSWTV